MQQVGSAELAGGSLAFVESSLCIRRSVGKVIFSFFVSTHFSYQTQIYQSQEVFIKVSKVLVASLLQTLLVLATFH